MKRPLSHRQNWHFLRTRLVMKEGRRIF